MWERIQAARTPINGNGDMPTVELHELRNVKNLSQRVLAEKAGMTGSNVASIENGRDPSLSAIRALLKALGATHLRFVATFGETDMDIATFSGPLGRVKRGHKNGRHVRSDAGTRRIVDLKVVAPSVPTRKARTATSSGKARGARKAAASFWGDKSPEQRSQIMRDRAAVRAKNAAAATA